jgi:hypothetical protein
VFFATPSDCSFTQTTKLSPKLLLDGIFEVENMIVRQLCGRSLHAGHRRILVPVQMRGQIMVTQILANLSKVLTVQDLMTPCAILQCADSFEDAEPLHSQYDVVPHPKAGPITGFFRRGTIELQGITAHVLLSNGTSILELPSLLNQNRFYFVISGNSIVGYVHYSDLNNTLAKIPFYTLLQTVERAMWERIQSQISEADLSKIFGSSDIGRFIKKRIKNRGKNIDIGWVGVFSFPFILKLARFYGYIQISDDQIELLAKIRNRVSHSDWNLVTQYDDIQMLIDTYHLSESLIKSA